MQFISIPSMRANMNQTLPRATEKHILHFSSAPLAQDEAPLFFNIGMQKYRVQPHTPATRADARADNPYLRLLKDSSFNHYLEVELPSDSVATTFLTQEVQMDGNRVERLAGLSLHIPRQGRLLADENALRRNRNKLHPKLALLVQKYGLNLQSHIPSDKLHDLKDPYEIAVVLMYQHPGLINLNATKDGATPETISRQCIGEALERRSLIIDRIAEAGDRWCFPIPLMDEGKQVIGEDGKPCYTEDLDDDVKSALSAPLILALKTAQQLAELEGQTWNVQFGKTTEEHDGLKGASLRASEPALRADQTKWASKSLNSTNGINVEWFDFRKPEAGGWSVKETWSSTSAEPITPEFVSALASGKAQIAVNQQIMAIPAQAIGENNTAQFIIDTKDWTKYKIALYLTVKHDDLEINIERGVMMAPHPVWDIKISYLNTKGENITCWERKLNNTSTYGELRATIRNDWLRHLSVYAEFFNTAGKAIEVKHWPDQIKDPTGIASSMFDNHKSKKYVGLLGPINTVFGIPLPADPETLNIPFPEDAASMRLYWGGLGTGKYDATVCACGITTTAVFEMAIPVMLLAFGASQVNTVVINDLLKPYVVKNAIFMLGAALAGGTRIGTAQDPSRAAKEVAAKLGPALAQTALKTIAVYMAAKGLEGAARRSIPLINLAFLALDAVVTGLQLAQTTAAVLQSPFYYETEFTRTFDLRVTFKPDPDFNRFPDYHDLLRVQVVYDSNATLPLSETSFKHRASEVLSDPIDIRFNDIPAGGKVRVLAFFYAASGWQSASCTSNWVEAKGNNGSSVLHLELTMKNALIPLSKDSVLLHRQKLVFENGRHRWKEGAAPTATVIEPGGDVDHRVMAWNSITVAQKANMLGYSWQATHVDLPRDSSSAGKTAEALYTVQNVSLLQDAEARYSVAPVGFTNQSGVAYDLAGAADGSGKSFWLDASKGNFHPTSNPKGGYHLRHIALSLGTTPEFKADTSKSWGRFAVQVDCFTHHPQGYVVGIAVGCDKLFILKLPDAPGPDSDATVASLASGEGSRDGLLLRPRAVAVALDGRLLVLEDGNRRIQSFDIFGNPVRYFKAAQGEEKSTFLTLRNTGSHSTTYLDLSVESKGYLFVLCYDDEGNKASQYRIDIYEPDGTFLVATPGVAAAKIAVDLARNVYTLNWDVLKGHNGRTEPTVSHWIPPAPKVKGEGESA